MGQPAKKTPTKPVAAKAKQKAAGFVNWSVLDPKTGEVVLRSNRGFTIYLNEHCTREEKALLDIAIANGGSATLCAELRIIVAQERPDVIDISGIKLAPKR
jgi:hypothetical protein